MFKLCPFDVRLNAFPGLFDSSNVHNIFSKFSKIITVEDGCIQGGIGSAILEFMIDNNYSSSVKRLGIPDKIVEHGEQYQLYAECGFDSEGIIKTVQAFVNSCQMSAL